MPTLHNKRILLGVTGGIAAYKAIALARRLKEMGATVRVAMTPNATEFVGALSFEGVTGQAIMEHIALARWPDAVLVAPATADFLARLTQGRADDLLTQLCLAAECPIAVAPAMNRGMWLNAATQDNVATLIRRGIRVLGPDDGTLACGETGPGRMLEPEALVPMLEGLFETGALDGIRALITAGPTFERLDPVRGITNRSSGKMGFALARAACEAGAEVTLVTGPVCLADPERVRVYRVESAAEMLAAIEAAREGLGLFIGAAAVADYRPALISARKIHKETEHLTIQFERTPDLIATVASWSPRPYVVGFAAETEDFDIGARKKLERKKLDLVVANNAHTAPGADDNELVVVDRQGGSELLARAPKERLARLLIARIARELNASRTPARQGPP